MSCLTGSGYHDAVSCKAIEVLLFQQTLLCTHGLGCVVYGSGGYVRRTFLLLFFTIFFSCYSCCFSFLFFNAVHCCAARAAAMVAAAAADASEARVAAAKHMLDGMVASRVEQAALRQAFSANIRTYDELTSSQVRGGGNVENEEKRTCAQKFPKNGSIVW